MNSPLFSIVTVTLNCAEDACRTAQSVLAQDFKDYEYLVKDGLSQDDTVGRLKQLGVENIHVLKDTGIYPAMNQALGLCRGRYVWFMNAGDIFASASVLSQFAAHIKAHGFPSFLYGDLETMVKHPFWQGAGDDSPRRIQTRSRLSRLLLYRRTICHQAWAVERELYERCGGLNEGLRVVADYEFLLKAILRLRVSYSRVPGVCVRYADGGDGERNLALAEQGRQKILGEYFSWWERMAYEALSGSARWVVHGRAFNWLQQYLPDAWQARLGGL